MVNQLTSTWLEMVAAARIVRPIEHEEATARGEPSFPSQVPKLDERSAVTQDRHHAVRQPLARERFFERLGRHDAGAWNRAPAPREQRSSPTLFGRHDSVSEPVIGSADVVALAHGRASER